MYRSAVPFNQPYFCLDSSYITYLLTYLLTPWSRVLEKLTGLQLVKKFTAFYGTLRFITACTTARQLSLSWATPIQFIPPHPTFWRFILILSSHIHICLPSGRFPSGFPTKPLYTPFPSPTRATCPANLIPRILRLKIKSFKVIVNEKPLLWQTIECKIIAKAQNIFSRIFSPCPYLKGDARNHKWTSPKQDTNVKYKYRPYTKNWVSPVFSNSGCLNSPCTMATRSFPGVKRPGRFAGHQPPSSAEVKRM
jgi:hypothetical protein